MTVRAVNSIVYGKFYDGTTGRVPGDFTYSVYLDDVASAQTISITEDALGWYKFNLALNAIGRWSIKISSAAMSYVDSWVAEVAESSEHQPGDTIAEIFYIGTTGLVQGDFTYLLTLNNAAAGSLTIAEVGSGYYRASWSASSSGDWFARIDYLDQHIGISAFVGNAAGEIVVNEPVQISVVEESTTITVLEETTSVVIS